MICFVAYYNNGLWSSVKVVNLSAHHYCELEVMVEQVKQLCMVMCKIRAGHLYHLGKV